MISKLQILELSSTSAWSELNYNLAFDVFTQFEDNVERIHAPNVNCQEFIDQYEKNYKPVVITGKHIRLIKPRVDLCCG